MLGHQVLFPWPILPVFFHRATIGIKILTSSFSSPLCCTEHIAQSSYYTPCAPARPIPVAVAGKSHSLFTSGSNIGESLILVTQSHSHRLLLAWLKSSSIPAPSQRDLWLLRRLLITYRAYAALASKQVMLSEKHQA